MAGCLIISHGQIARAYIDVCRQMVGTADSLFTLDCSKLTAKDLYKEMLRLLEKEKLSDGLIILVSLRGGSCWNVAVKISKQYPNVEVISGLNLPLILSFLTKKDKYKFSELKEIVYKDGIRGINRIDIQ